ncbi:MAG: Rrf2 family transcriptional regulator [Thermoleophilia bacterium]|nr:Rrf2 family transcriptional regulator [Thermoleophilia bacterium]
MLISSKSEYGLRALMDIAVNETGTPVSRAGISQRQQIPLPYLTQVLRALVNGGLLKSNRGPAGGYTLNREPREISVLDVVTLLQGPVLPAGCAGAGGATSECEKLDGCGLVGVWSELKSSSENVLGQTTLRDIISKNRLKPASGSDEIAEKLDCIGVSCPLPIVHIAETMRKLGTGQVLEVWADDEGAKADIPAWCMGTGNDFIGREEFGDQMKFLIRKII